MKPAVIQKPAAPGNYFPGRRSPISRITFHHIVGDAPAAIARFQTPGVEVSAHYVIGSNGAIYQCVADQNTAYCDGSADSNARTISIEHAGGIEGVPYTDAMYAASVTLVAYLITKYGISDFQRHRDVIDKTAYPGGTACPGALDVERIIKAAQEGGDMATNAQVDEIIATAHQGVFGTPAPDVDFNNLRPLLSANLAEGVLEMLKQYNNNADAAYKQTSSKYEQITDPVYRKKTK